MQDWLSAMLARQPLPTAKQMLGFSTADVVLFSWQLDFLATSSVKTPLLPSVLFPNVMPNTNALRPSSRALPLRQLVRVKN
jgi:hypothetical protein